jgi:asparagine synthase (glutamine-hydrolysing)
MCGICGVIGHHDDERLIQTMTRTLAHRGPDGEGVRHFAPADSTPRAALGHRRLSIIDPTERGAQPMADESGRYWITYNGELYNFRELREELRSEGWRFVSDCDTEVLLAMYARHGAAMLTRLNGIFAFAIWDARLGHLFLARDRLGVKPLYHAQRQNLFAFGSEIKALLPALPRTRINETAVADFLTFLWVPDPDTLHDGIYQLPAGHHATYADGRLAVSQYWDASFDVEPGRGADLWAGDVRQAVSAAIRRQMVSDVPIGSFLSGGLDSSAIVAEMSAASDVRVPTYTVGFSAADLGHEIIPDDVRYARQVAEAFDTEYHERMLEADVVDLLPRLMWHLDDPIADPAAITTFLICSAAREQLTVILSGMGGDEVFAGYPRHLAAKLARMGDVVPRRLRSAAAALVDRRMTMGPPGRLRGPRRNLMKLARGIGDASQSRYLTYCSYYRPDELSRMLSSELRAQLRDHDPFRHHLAHFDRVRDAHWLNQLLYVDMKTFLPCLNLAYTDRMSMAASTEVRVPLLDDEVVTLAGRIPADLKLRRMQRKHVFKRSQQGILPEEVIWRPKAGFGAPLRAWLSHELRPMVDDLLSPDSVRARGLFAPAEVQRVIAADRNGSEDNALRIWTLLTLELWQQTHMDGPAPAPAPAPVLPVPFAS